MTLKLGLLILLATLASAQVAVSCPYPNNHFEILPLLPGIFCQFGLQTLWIVVDFFQAACSHGCNSSFFVWNGLGRLLGLRWCLGSGDACRTCLMGGMFSLQDCDPSSQVAFDVEVTGALVYKLGVSLFALAFEKDKWLTASPVMYQLMMLCRLWLWRLLTHARDLSSRSFWLAKLR